VVATHRVVMVAVQLGSCAQGCHGYPTHPALLLEAPLSFQAPSPSSSIVDEFKCYSFTVPHDLVHDFIRKLVFVVLIS